MNFRTRLLVAFGVVIAATAILVSAAISAVTTATFERVDAERTQVLVAQFQREFDWRSRELMRRIDAIAASEPVRHMGGADPALYLDQAATLAAAHDLDFLELLDRDGAIVSSAHYPAHFGYRKEWVTRRADWTELGAFVDNEELPDGRAVAMLAVRMVETGDSKLYILGGYRLDKDFISSIPLPEGIHAELRLGSGEPHGRANRIPLKGRTPDLPASLVVTGSREDLDELKGFIRWVGIFGAALGLMVGIAVAWWASARVTRPVRLLAEGAREVAAGNWNARVEIASSDEIGDLASAFNQMTRELTEQRDRLIQVERVAAWRELARRLAHELKNPLFPLQITVENLQRARLQHPQQFDEVFRESTTTLLAEITNLKHIVSRFSDFARMPSPRFEPVPLESFLRSLIRLFEAQWSAPDRARIQGDVSVSDPRLTVEADPELLNRALRNLVLNAMDAMPNGGRLTLRAFANGSNHAVIEVSDTGAGLTPEECERLCTPYYTTKQHGTGLGLAIAQSVVSDHGGRISVASRPGEGATFRIELPCSRTHHDGSPASD